MNLCVFANDACDHNIAWRPGFRAHVCNYHASTRKPPYEGGLMILRVRNDVLQVIEREMGAAQNKYGPLPTVDPHRTFVVLAREVGEVAQALPHSNPKHDQTQQHLFEELVQTAATAVRWIQQLADAGMIEVVM